MLRKIINWLQEQKDIISSIGSIVQIFVLIIGIFIAINEIYIKGSETNRERIKRTVDLAHSFSAGDFEKYKKKIRNCSTLFMLYGSN